MTFSLDSTYLHGNTAYIVWHAETADNVYDMASDTLDIQDGHIVTQTVALSVTPK